MSARSRGLSTLITFAFLAAVPLIPSDLVAQSESGASSCVSLTRNLFLGLNDARTGGQVSALQRFLTQTGDFTYGSITGYFGPLTEAAVQQWQCRKMQLCSGGPEENGWGVVGPLTRRAMQAGCDALFPPTPTPPPSQDFSATPQSGPAPLTVTFAGSYETSGLPVPFRIRVTFGDGSAPVERGCKLSYPKSRCALSNVSHTYAAGSYAAKIEALLGLDGNLVDTRLQWSRTITAGPGSTDASCTLDGVTVLHGQSRTFYLTDIVFPGNSCSSVSQLRTCTNGVLSESNTYSQASCRVAGSGDTTPVAEWKFDEFSGTIAIDSSGNGNNGILENGATRYVGTQQGNKLELDGMDDRMRVDATVSSNILNMESFTVAAWVRPTEYSGIIMRKGNTERGRFNFGIRSDGVLYLLAGYSERTGSWQTTATLPLNTWSHVAVTYFYGISNKPTLYVNGVQQALRPSVANPGTYDPADPLGTPAPDTPYLYLGNTHDFVNRSQPGFDSAFEGRMDIVRVYNSILSASDIQTLFNENRVDNMLANNASCTLDGVTVLHGQSRTFYSTNTVSAGQSCSSVSQSRTCSNGAFSGSSSYQYAQCTPTTGDEGAVNALF